MTRDDFAPTASWENLRLRARLLRRTREFFDERGFLEVETPVLSSDTVIDRYIDPIPVELPRCAETDARPPTLWLQTSPESGMKRLLAAGAQAIYQIARAFRAGERGSLHNPEFTMLEWYRCGDGMSEGTKLLADLADALLGLGPAELISYGEAFQRHAGVDPFSADNEALRRAAHQLSITIPRGMGEDREQWLNLLLAECVEGHLGAERPTILYDYPVSQAMLARIRTGQPPLAERFELYVNGIELANGCHELLEPDELCRRMDLANRQRASDGRQVLPGPGRLLAAMQHGLPDCTGVALGLDRLVMVAAGAKTLAEVMSFPVDRT